MMNAYLANLLTSNEVGRPLGGGLVRDFCCECGEPMRVDHLVAAEGRRVWHWCEKCDPGKPPPSNLHLTYRQAISLGKSA